MNDSFLAYPLGSTFESCPFVPDTEDVPVGPALYAAKDAVLLSLPVLTAAGLKKLKNAKG